MSGYQMQRGWMEHDLFKDEPYTRAMAWEWMIGEAAWKPTRKRIAAMKYTDLKRGQFTHSIRFMATKFQWSVGRVQRLISELTELGMIDTATEHSQTIVTIRNYSQYQFTPKSLDTQNDTGAIQERYKEEEGKETTIVVMGKETPEGMHEDFWKAWTPYEMGKGSKQESLKSYKRALKETDHASLMAAGNSYTEHCRAVGCKTKHVSTWLNQRGWAESYGSAGAPAKPVRASGKQSFTAAAEALATKYAEQAAREEAAALHSTGQAGIDGLAGPDSHDAESIWKISNGLGIPRGGVLLPAGQVHDAGNQSGDENLHAGSRGHTFTGKYRPDYRPELSPIVAGSLHPADTESSTGESLQPDSGGTAIH